jgi:16S rRNA processing protein RimM
VHEQAADPSVPTEGSSPAPVVVGEIARPHGIRGEVAVNVFSDNPDRFAAGSRVWVGTAPGTARPATVARSRSQPGHGGRVILLLEETLDRTMAEELRGALLFAAPDDAPAPLEEDAYWEQELVGLEVRDPSGTVLGALTGVLTRPEQDLWEMEGPSGSVLIPASKAIVRSVDVAAGMVVVDLPPGLLGG